MTFLLTLVMTFIFVLAAILVFVRIGTPIYLVKKRNLVTLFNMVLDGHATENDWQVFLGVPIRHNDRLEDIRRRCCELSEREYIGGDGVLFTEKGKEEIRQLLLELDGVEE